MTADSAPRATDPVLDDVPPTMIHLDAVSKTYPGSTVPAVADLDLEIPEGEIVVFVGPSGCGKSTTLRLINRMIEPSSGRIIFDGDDVTEMNPDKLRRQIGYVIQQIGLFPHQTIRENVATVPKLAGWPKAKIRDRVDELLDLTGLDPATFGDRYPKELSGGQAQRVGVARALGADPAVLLMDEPFGAIDPITRDRLQNEFLRLQADLKKTIVFVTHDIDEAIKMGDRIAILGDQSRIAQFDTPERILAYPVDDFVSDFIGAGATLKGLNFERIRDLEITHDFPVLRTGDDIGEARRMLDASPEKWALILDTDDRPARWANEDHLHRATDLASAGRPVVSTVPPHATLHDALEEMLISSAGCSVVVDDQKRYSSILDISTLTEVLNRMRSEARKHYEELAAAQPTMNGNGGTTGDGNPG